jgi:GDP-L-fucose synthase
MIADPFPLVSSKGLEYLLARRVAVTGASGLIGSYVVKLLRGLGVGIVRAIVHARSPNEFTKMAHEIVEVDLMRAPLDPKVFEGCSVVVSCAGITGGVNLPSQDPVSYVGPASVIAMNTLHAAHLAHVERIGWLSSTTVYPPLPRPAVEDDSHLPDALYPLYRGIGESKRFIEKLYAYYHEAAGIGTAVIRPAGAYGRFDNFDERTSHVLPGMVTRALNLKPGQSFDVWGDGEDVRDFIHAQDVARCLLLAICKDTTARPYNAASGLGVTTKTLAKIVLYAAGSVANIKTQPNMPTALRARLVDITRAQEELGFTPEISLARGVQDVVDYRRDV